MVHYQLVLLKGTGARVVYVKQLSISRAAYIASREDVTMTC